MILSNNKMIIIPVLAGILFTLNISAQDTDSRFSIDKNRLIWENEGELFKIEAFGENTLRFRASRSLHISDENWNILDQPEVIPEIKIMVGKAVIINGTIRAEIRERDGLITYLDNKDKILLKEAFHHHVPRFARQYDSKGSNHFKIMLTFEAEKDEHIYGMGQYPNDCLNLKGTVLELAQKNTQISIPFFISSKGYGFIWNNPSIGRADFSMTHTSFTAEYAKQIDYFISQGNKPAELVRKYSDMTGKAPEMPEYGAGFWQSKLRYYSQEDLMKVAREYKKRNLPISVIVADFFHWPETGDWKFDPEYWPDPKGMVEELEAMGIKLLVSVWPTVNMNSENYQTLRKNNYLIRPENGVNTFLPFAGYLTYIDPFHPGAREFIWSKLKQNYYDLGIRMFWLDESEPEMEPLDYENVRYYRGNGLEISSLYPYYLSKAIYEGQVNEGQEEIINLTRSGWIGIQRFGTVLWSGDIYGDFETLRRQVKAGLNISLCGIPWWNSDIGGFFSSGLSKEDFNEVLIRWFQYGAFCPVMRLHGQRPPYTKVAGSPMHTGAPNEVWSYGKEAYGIMSRYLRIREKLKPYILENMKKASADGTPMMRPLFYDFPDDKQCWEVEDQYMFGPDLLIAPVLEKDAKSRIVYLPFGAEWTDALTGSKYKGGQTINYKVSIENIPVFTRNGYDFSLK